MELYWSSVYSIYIKSINQYFNIAFCFVFSLFFSSSLSITARDRIAETQMMANYQEFDLLNYLTFCEHFVKLHFCFNHFHTCVYFWSPLLIIRPRSFYSVKHTAYRTILIMTNIVIYQNTYACVCVCICDFFAFVCPSLLAGNTFISNSSSI